MPAPYTIADFAAAIPDVLTDTGNKLYPKANAAQTLVLVLTPFVVRAIERYSKDRALELMSDVAGNGTALLPLPSVATENSTAPVFDPLSSQVLEIEYPVDQNPPSLLDAHDYGLRRRPDGFKLMLLSFTLNQGEAARVTWTARHATDGSTIPDRDFYALVDLAAAFAAEQLATVYAQTGDPTMSVDVVNYRSKSQEYLGLAKMLRRRYYSHLGVDESSTGAAEIGPSMAVGEQYLNMQSGVGRLIHQRGSR